MYYLQMYQLQQLQNDNFLLMIIAKTINIEITLNVYGSMVCG
jgi:hypothetical protein